MYIRKVISFEGSWNRLITNHPSEYLEIQNAINLLTKKNIRENRLHDRDPNEINYRKLRGCWDTIIQENNWHNASDFINTNNQKTTHLRLLGHYFNDISIKFVLSRDVLNRWLFTITPLARSNSTIKIPVAIQLIDSNDINESFNIRLKQPGFEYTKKDLEALAP